MMVRGRAAGLGRQRPSGQIKIARLAAFRQSFRQALLGSPGVEARLQFGLQFSIVQSYPGRTDQ
jgi:hypothetical protein